MTDGLFAWWVVALGCSVFGVLGFGLCAILSAGKLEDERQAGHTAGFRLGYDNGWAAGYNVGPATETIGTAQPVTLDFTDTTPKAKRKPAKRTATKKRGKAK